MSLFRLFLYFVLAVALLGAVGLLLGADCLVVALIGQLALVGLLRSAMGAEGAASHPVR